MKVVCVIMMMQGSFVPESTFDVNSCTGFIIERKYSLMNLLYKSFGRAPTYPKPESTRTKSYLFMNYTEKSLSSCYRVS